MGFFDSLGGAFGSISSGLDSVGGFLGDVVGVKDTLDSLASKGSDTLYTAGTQLGDVGGVDFWKLFGFDPPGGKRKGKGKGKGKGKRKRKLKMQAKGGGGGGGGKRRSGAGGMALAGAAVVGVLLLAR